MHVIGTTGIDAAGDAAIAEAAQRTAIVKTGNFSLGVTLLAALVRKAAAALGEDEGALEDLVEPYLMQVGFLDRTPQGRKATDAAYAYLGVKSDPGPLFR